MNSPARRPPAGGESATARSLRRAEVLMQRRRAATARQRRGFGLRAPAELPIILGGSGRARLR
ncbi:MAG: hypothetical protein ACXV0U_09610 [Kineosporiaceae bacterium]